MEYQNRIYWQQIHPKILKGAVQAKGNDPKWKYRNERRNERRKSVHMKINIGEHVQSKNNV